jgi:hypothetical protein
MKNALPDNAKIAKDAKECVQECVTEFIAFITSEGNSPAQLALEADGCSIREVSSRKEEDGEWRGYYICHDLPWL